MRTFYVSLKVFLLLTVLTGMVYPLILTGIAQIAFPEKANGSLVVIDNKVVGSKLIGQQFNSSKYFSSRPSYISYNPLPSGGTNYGLTNTRLKNLVNERKKLFISFNQLDSITAVPSEMLFASASGLDPHISQNAALLQVERISKARMFNNIQKQNLIQKIKDLTENPQFMILGEKRINVLVLNIELDKLDTNVLDNN
jgi:potassium-transporting ATPase KdpC subunit